MSLTDNDRAVMGIIFLLSAIGSTIAMIMGPDDPVLEFATIFSVSLGMFALMTGIWILYRLLSNHQPH